MQHLLDVLETFCQIIKLMVNVLKTKNDGNKGNITIHYPLLHTRENRYKWFKVSNVLWLMSLSTNRWNVCYKSRIQAGWNSYCMFENQCNKSDTRWREVRLMLFNNMVIQVLLYRVEVQGGTISFGAWNEIEKIQKWFLHDSNIIDCHDISST